MQPVFCSFAKRTSALPWMPLLNKLKRAGYRCHDHSRDARIVLPQRRRQLG
jgi:hypothetical protein